MHVRRIFLLRSVFFFGCNNEKKNSQRRWSMAAESFENKKKSQQQNFAKPSKYINLIVDVYVCLCDSSKCPVFFYGIFKINFVRKKYRERITPKKIKKCVWKRLLNHMFLYQCSFPFIATSSVSLFRSHTENVHTIRDVMSTMSRNVCRFRAMILAFVGVREFFELFKTR